LLFFFCYESEIWNLLNYLLIDFVCESGEARQVEWSKIQTPTDEVVVPYDTLESAPEGN